MEKEFEELLKSAARKIREIMGTPSVSRDIYYYMETELAEITLFVGNPNGGTNSEVPNEVIDVFIELQNDCIEIYNRENEIHEFHWDNSFSEVQLSIDIIGLPRPFPDEELTNERIAFLTQKMNEHSDLEKYELAAIYRDMIARRQRQIAENN
jgi:hypothetical protein